MFILSKKFKKNLLIVLGITLVLAFLLIVFAIISPFIMLANEGAFLKADLDNPHIDSNYNGWYWAKIDNWGKCLFPMEWDITQDKDIIQIINEDGTVIAFGAVLNAEKSAFESREAFLSHIFNYKVEEISVSHTPNFVPIKGSFLGTVNISGEIEKTCGIFILNEYQNSISSQLFFVFLEHENMDSTEMVEITQAISFSYSFPKNCKR